MIEMKRNKVVYLVSEIEQFIYNTFGTNVWIMHFISVVFFNISERTS